MLTSTDSTATSAIDGNNSSFNIRASALDWFVSQLREIAQIPASDDDGDLIQACSLPATKSTGQLNGRPAMANSSSRPPTPDTSTSTDSPTRSAGSNTRLHHYRPTGTR
ncbi:hypothetical protein [Streptomyces sp. NPDC093149]|uniref:hypothetical protein n=1 Tax=Streptomyces sp. NPDC093149 TaxID=3366031 RepID=UPI00380691B1